jgi:hypothetical protein
MFKVQSVLECFVKNRWNKTLKISFKNCRDKLCHGTFTIEIENAVVHRIIEMQTACDEIFGEKMN